MPGCDLQAHSNFRKAQREAIGPLPGRPPPAWQAPAEGSTQPLNYRDAAPPSLPAALQHPALPPRTAALPAAPAACRAGGRGARRARRAAWRLPTRTLPPWCGSWQGWRRRRAARPACRTRWRRWCLREGFTWGLGMRLPPQQQHACHSAVCHMEAGLAMHPCQQSPVDPAMPHGQPACHTCSKDAPTHPPVSPPASRVWRSPSTNPLPRRRWKNASWSACLANPMKGKAA